MRKTTIKSGDLDVEVEITGPLVADGAPSMNVKMTCGSVTREHRLTVAPDETQTDEQFQKEVTRAVTRWAAEAAGHERGKKLIERYVSAQPREDKSDVNIGS